MHSGYTLFDQYVCSLGIEPTNFCADNAMLYCWATETPSQFTQIIMWEKMQCTIWKIRQSVKTSNHWICHQSPHTCTWDCTCLNQLEKYAFFNASWVWVTKSMGQFLSDFVAGFEIFKWVFAIWSFWEFSISPVKKIGIVVSDARNSCLEV